MVEPTPTTNAAQTSEPDRIDVAVPLRVEFWFSKRNIDIVRGPAAP